MRRTVAILGVPIDVMTTSEVIERIEEFVRSGRFHQIATANTDFLVKAHDDPELMAILRSADLVVADGMPLVLASRCLRASLPERVAGSDLVPILAGLSASKGYRLFLLGGEPDALRLACARMEERWPGVRVAGALSPPFASVTRMDNEGILAEIEKAEPDILLVAFGNPKQEKWIHMHRRRLRVPACIGVGASLDFIAGTKRRAPAWMQRSGLEWAHRLACEPRRLARRYGVDGVQFARLMCAELWRMRGRREVASHIESGRAGDCTVISVRGSAGGSHASALADAADRALTEGTHVILDLSATTAVDSYALGVLINLLKRAAHAGKEVRVVGARGRVRRALGLESRGCVFSEYPSFASALLAGEAQVAPVALDAADPDVACLRVEGRADESRCDSIAEKLEALPPAVRTIQVDLTSATYIDSAVLALLRDLTQSQQALGRKVVVAASPAVRRAILRERLDGDLNLLPTPRATQPQPSAACPDGTAARGLP